ncbi:uncharacterized protein APUU_70315S [Aspergillus puulaauensis]|uniref:Zn(2)-C6 fungal-type domain-containing protein n=1 Tax=Aspergillus puulaauensis TaxID=1220207 RepID=A0A7R7XW12_9EURO|nr:uncharacterized protein APUU_70315S [Aspergillus puulaauensis]BCS28745.1 hypothetical protein APUU_70315S [Aspergillus puulaauensis]
MPPERRKVRKGTHNCWECKRRKVRCIFSAEHAVCNNCKRRGTACISQELPDSYTAHPTSNQTEARLERVEGLLARLVNTARDESLEDSVSEDSEHQKVSQAPSAPSKQISVPSDRSGKYDALCRELIAAWPSEHDLDGIASLPTGLSIPLYQIVCSPCAVAEDAKPPSPREMLQLPPPGSHPVLVARSLMLLGTFLQGVVPSVIQKLGPLGDSYREIMATCVDRAIRLVNTNDELTGFVEALQCILLEVMYQNYTGHLHRAWMAVRRATATAQVMGIHQGRNSPYLKFLEPATRAAFDPDYVCFRLIQMDRYLSLMLGLPQTPVEGRFAIPKDVSAFGPMACLERIYCEVSGRIPQRTAADINDISQTRETDKLLQDAAAQMPPQWWLIPPFTNEADIVSDTIRLMIQFTHHHLLARLHMPYLLRCSPENNNIYDYSRITAVNASRELLSRYVVFRTVNPAHFYCRGCDFLAFVATTVMCLAHISFRSHRVGHSSVFNFLMHSRPMDRGMMERTSEIIESMARESTSDAIAPKLTHIIRHLLDVESNAANGAIYCTSSSRGEGEISGRLSDEALHIHIPYFGTINFEHGSVFRSAQHTDLGQAFTEQMFHQPQGVLSGLHAEYPDIQPEQLQIPTSDHLASDALHDPMLSGIDDWDLQGIDIALFDSLFAG